MKDTREFQTIRVEVEDALGSLTLNRPERLNAVGATMLQELAEAARWFDSHRELRVVIVSGTGRAFCAGADLKDSPAAAIRESPQGSLGTPQVRSVFEKLFDDY